MGLHPNLTGDELHIIHRWEVADETARLALSVTAADVGKVAKQLSPLSWWVLSDDDPMAWIDLTAGGGAISHDSLTGVTANQHHAQLHGSSHHNGAGDAVKLDDLAIPDDNTDLDASTTRHGLLRKLDNDGNHYLDGEGNWTTPAGGGGTFGADYASEESLGESSTTSGDFQTKVQMVTPALTGTYRVGFSARVWQSNVADSVVTQLYNVTDDVALCGPYDDEPENSTNRYQATGFATVVFTGAAKTLEIQYCQDRGSTAYIDQARLEIWRVA